MTKLEQLRKEKHLQRQELADISGVQVETIKSYELGKGTLENASPSIICRLAVGLNVNVSELVEVEDFIVFESKVEAEIYRLNKDLTAVKSALSNAKSRDLLK